MPYPAEHTGILNLMSAVPNLYDDGVILDHIKNARNYRVLEDAQNTIKSLNPLCGDEIILYLKIRVGQIEDISFQCTSCGISMASASIMTEYVKGQSTNEMIKSVRAFIALLNDCGVPSSVAEDIRLQPIVEAVRYAKSRIGCAVLAWTALESALQSHGSSVISVQAG